MQRSGFKPPTKEKLAELQAKKLERLKLKQKEQKVLGSLKNPKGTLEAKNGRVRGKKKTERQKTEEKLWEECKRIIRSRYENTCYTCGAIGLEAHNWQTGHGKPKGALPLRYKYDLRNLRPQCMRDNIHYGGLSDIFVAKLEREEEGLQFLEEACRKTPEGWIIKKESDLGGKDALIFLQNLLVEYKNL